MVLKLRKRGAMRVKMMMEAGLLEWQKEQVALSRADSKAGRVVAHERVVEWVRSWGTADELPKPTCKNAELDRGALDSRRGE